MISPKIIYKFSLFFQFALIFSNLANASPLARIFFPCAYEQSGECVQNDCIWDEFGKGCRIPRAQLMATTACLAQYDMKDCRKPVYCSGIDRDQCDEIESCRWNGKRCIAKTPDSVKCSSFESIDYCVSKRCLWDETAETCFTNESQSCSEIRSQNACEQIDSCIWDTHNGCLDTTNKRDCAKARDVKTCSRFASCDWTGRNCIVSDRSIFSRQPNKLSCKEYETIEQCRVKHCIWETKTKLCIPDDIKSCEKARSQDVCGQLKECVWENTKAICLQNSDHSCEQAASSTICEQINHCIWEEGHGCLGRQNVENIEKFVTSEENCDRLAPLSAWTGKRCVPSSLAGYPIELLCTLYETIDHCEQDGAAARHCIWHASHSKCISELSSCSMAGYSQDVCNRLGCMWDKNTGCNSFLASCASFTEQLSCQAIRGCDWNSENNRCESSTYNALAYAAEYLKKKSQDAAAEAFQIVQDNSMTTIGVITALAAVGFRRHYARAYAAGAIAAGVNIPVPLPAGPVVNQCGICLQAVSNPDISLANCRHYTDYCGQCLSIWLARQNSCPSCRTPGNPPPQPG